MRKNITTIILLLLSSVLSFPTFSQNIKGFVMSDEGEDETLPLPGAVVQIIDTEVVAVSDNEGKFVLHHAPKDKNMVVASFVGYKNDTLNVSNLSEVKFVLKPAAVEVDGVIIKSRKSNSISAYATEKKELITFAGLCKMACCNLAESFENSASVTVGYSDAVSGARQIKLLGYSGTYTQMLDETRPIMRGLSSTYGLEYTPGMWLQGIQISKGVTSVVNGYEALTGQINIEHRKPTDEDPLFVNLFANQDLRAEANITSAIQINEKLSTVILTHVSMDQKKLDHNGDGFLDMPLKEQYNVGNRWLYQFNDGTQMRVGLRGLYEERKGGEMEFVESERSLLEHYGSNILNKDFNAYLKIGKPLIKNKLNIEDEGYEDETTSNIAMVADYNYHQQDAFFGLKDYYGVQNSYYVNLLHQINFGKRHQFIAGATLTADIYKESLTDRFFTDDNPISSQHKTPMENYHNFDRDLITAGVFGEYTFKLDEKLDVIAGVRGDKNNKYGWMFTPRGHFKWNITDRTTLRGSAGVGYRIMSLVTDNIGMLATGRELVFDDNINPMERGFTAGGSFTQTFNLFNDPNASISVDYFRSQFSDQVVVDQESRSDQILFYNLTGDSFTNTYQADFSFAPMPQFNIFATYRYNDTRVTLRNDLEVVTPLIDKFKGLVNLQYATKFDRWTFDFTAQLNGQSRLPVQNGVIAQSEYSPIYPMFFGQVTRKLGKVDVYLGCENIGNYTQSNPILSAGDPFSSKFNSTVVWGPIMGRTFYVGMRYTL